VNSFSSKPPNKEVLQTRKVWKWGGWESNWAQRSLGLWKKIEIKTMTLSLESLYWMRDRSEPKCAHHRRGITHPWSQRGKRVMLHGSKGAFRRLLLVLFWACKCTYIRWANTVEKKKATEVPAAKAKRIWIYFFFKRKDKERYDLWQTKHREHLCSRTKKMSID